MILNRTAETYKFYVSLNIELQIIYTRKIYILLTTKILWEYYSTYQTGRKISN